MKCETCGRGIADGIVVYRNNPKGEPGVWRCEKHLDKAADPEVKRIAEMIASKQDTST